VASALGAATIPPRRSWIAAAVSSRARALDAAFGQAVERLVRQEGRAKP
jgi:hypothetical protein